MVITVHSCLVFPEYLTVRQLIGHAIMRPWASTLCVC